MDIDQINPSQINSLLQISGVTTANGGINIAGIIANLLFGTIGFVALMYGWKNKAPKPLAIGLALSVFPFFVSNTLWLYVIGTALTALLYFWRD